MNHSDVWDWWRAAVRNPASIGTNGLLVHPDTPEIGFYRVNDKREGRWKPVAIFLDDERVIHAELDGRPVNPLHVGDLWHRCCRFPIAYKTYETALESGKFNDEPPPPAGHNLPSDADPLDRLTAEFEGERELVERFLNEPIADQDAADRAGIWAKRLTDIAKRATELFTVEKRPVIDEAKRIDDKWRSIRERPAALAAQLKRHVDGFLIAKQRAERDRVEKAKAEALKLQREAEEKAKLAAMQETPQTLVDAGAAVAAAQEAVRQATYQRPQAGRTGAKVTLRTFRRAEISDYPVFLAAVAEQPEIKDAAQTVADRFARNRVKADGMEIHEEQRAV